jgi:hypothetical protein
MSSPLEPVPVPVPAPESASKYQSAVDEVIALLIDRIKKTAVAQVEAEIKQVDVVAVKRCCLQWWGH